MHPHTPFGANATRSESIATHTYPLAARRSQPLAFERERDSMAPLAAVRIARTNSEVPSSPVCPDLLFSTAELPFRFAQSVRTDVNSG